MLGRLLEEISWEGNARHYREGGRGLENVLTAEVFQALDYLPRTRFLGSVVQAFEGGSAEAKELLCDEVEGATVEILPGDIILSQNPPRGQTPLSVQPDGLIETGEVYGLIEAKRIRAGSFQAEQLAREFVTAHQEASGRCPLVLLVLPDPPPVKVAKNGRLSIPEAITRYLDPVLERAEADLPTAEALAESIDSTVAWITWETIGKVVSQEADQFSCGDSSVDDAVRRLARSLIRAIGWHA